MNDMADLPGLPQGIAEALANGTLADPFAVLGPRDMPGGPVVRAFLPGALEVEVQIPEVFAHDLSIGMPAEVQDASGKYTGSVSAVSPEVVNGQVTGRVRFGDNKPAGLRQNPTLTLLGQGINLPEINNYGGNTYFYSANVSRLFERGQKRRWRLDSASATADETLAKVALTQTNIKKLVDNNAK